MVYPIEVDSSRLRSLMGRLLAVAEFSRLRMLGAAISILLLLGVVGSALTAPAAVADIEAHGSTRPGIPSHKSLPKGHSLSENLMLPRDELQNSFGLDGTLASLENPGTPNGCTTAITFAFTCSHSYQISSWPSSTAYPFWVRIQVYESPEAAERELGFVQEYRPKQDGVVGVPRKDKASMSVVYRHPWNSESAFAIQREGRYLVQSACAATTGRDSLGRLQECVESVNAAQMGRLNSTLGPALSVPARPEQFQITSDGRRLKMTWLPPVDDGGDGISSYLVESLDGRVVCEVRASRGTPLECEASVSASDSDRLFVVYARNSVGRSAPSVPASVRVAEKTLGAPKQVRARATGSGARVTWKRVAGDHRPRLRYQVVATPSGKSCTTTRLTCVIRDLVPGREYSFQVRAISGNVRGSSTASRPLRVPVPDLPPRRPSPVPSPAPVEPPKPAIPFE